MNTVVEKQTPRPTQTETAPACAPGVNIFETADGFVLQAEMPGVNKSGLTVNLDANVLTLEGRRQTPAPPGRPLYRETRAADYRRTFQLDPEIDAERISARIEQGVLTVQLPKAEKVKPRKIEVG